MTYPMVDAPAVCRQEAIGRDRADMYGYPGAVAIKIVMIDAPTGIDLNGPQQRPRRAHRASGPRAGAAGRCF